MRSRDDSGHNLVLDVVVINLNRFHMLMKSGTTRDIDVSLIIAIHGIGEGEDIPRSSRSSRSHIISYAVWC